MKQLCTPILIDDVLKIHLHRFMVEDDVAEAIAEYLEGKRQQA